MNVQYIIEIFHIEIFEYKKNYITPTSLKVMLFY